jgi:hypothetical protein
VRLAHSVGFLDNPNRRQFTPSLSRPWRQAFVHPTPDVLGFARLLEGQSRVPRIWSTGRVSRRYAIRSAARNGPPRFSEIPLRSLTSYAAITASIGTPNSTG